MQPEMSRNADAEHPHSHAPAPAHLSANECRRVLEAVPSLILVLDNDSVVRYANRASTQILGRHPAEMVEQDLLSLVHPADRGRVRNCLPPQREGTASVETVRIEHRDGSWRAFTGRAHGWIDDAGTARSVLACCDITDRLSREELLQESHDELWAVFEHAPIMMLLVDDDRRVVKINRSALDFLDTDAEELIGVRGGDAMRCIHALDDPLGCGFGPHCEHCTVRNTVLDTFETGEPHHRVAATLERTNDGADTATAEELDIRVSTARIELWDRALVLVSIER